MRLRMLVAGFAGLVLIARPAAADPCPTTTSSPLEELCRSVGVVDRFADRKDPFDHTAVTPHGARVLHDGADSLLTRLELIEKASTSIDIAAYQFADDQGGRLLLQALTNAAGRGVRVRILMDRYEAPGKSIIGQELAAALAASGVQVSYYNVAEWWKPLARTRRNHRKMLIVDGEKLVTGGRNWSDDYWDLTYSGYTFMDRDVLVQGDSAASAAESFKAHLDHPWTVDAMTAFKGEKASAPLVARAKDSLTPGLRDVETRTAVETAAGRQRSVVETHSVPRVTFLSDKPGPDGPGVMRCHRALMDLIAKAEKSVVIETYSFFPGAESEKAFTEVMRKNVKLAILTNSHHTEGNPMVAAFGHDSQKRLVAAGADVYGLGGWPSPVHVDARPEGTYSYWGTHAKTIVIDSKTVVIGSFNFDPRSGKLNVESGVILHDAPALAQEVEGSIWERTASSWKLEKDGTFKGGPKEVFDTDPWMTRWAKRTEVFLKQPFKGQY